MKRIQSSAEGRRRRLRRALAGMAICFSMGLAITIGIIANNHSRVLRRPATSDPPPTRIAAINQTAERPKRQAPPGERSLRDARAQVEQQKLMEESKDRVMAVLIAPDHKTIQLTSPVPGEIANGTVTVSEKVEGAVLALRALPSPPAGQFCDAWWMLKNAPPAKAAEFVSGVDQSLYIDPPPPGSVPISFSVTIEPSRGATAPSGPVMLQGNFPESARQIATQEKNSAGARFSGRGQKKLDYDAALSSDSWYLMVPPLEPDNNQLNRAAPPSRWSIISSFGTEGECSSALIGPGGQPIYRAAVCMAANDPRLRSK